MASSFEDLAEATSGAIGGLLSTSILYPLDTCKTKYQAEARVGNSRRYRSTFDVLKEAYSTGQCISLYQGLGTKNFQSFLSQFIYFYSYSFIKNLYLRKVNKKRMGTGANLIVAAAAGACTSLVIQPLDTASARMQTSTFGKSKSLWRTLRDADWRHAYDGLGASLILTSNPAIQYTVYEQLKGRILRLQRHKTSASGDSSPVVLSALTAFLLGALSKTIATIITYPAIRCKVLLQAAEQEDEDRVFRKSSKSMVDAIMIIWNSEGARGFYKGLQAQILKTILSASIMLMIKEKTSRSTWFLMMALRRWLSPNQRRIKVT